MDDKICTVKLTDKHKPEGQKKKEAIDLKNQKLHHRELKILFQCHLTNFLIKTAQLIFIFYVIVLDSDITALFMEIAEDMQMSWIGYAEKAILTFMLAFIFMSAGRGYIKVMKKLHILIEAHKRHGEIIIPTNFSNYTRYAIYEVISTIFILILLGFMNYYGGMDLKEYIVSAIFDIVAVYYITIHTLEGIILLHKRRTIARQAGKTKPYW